MSITFAVCALIAGGVLLWLKTGGASSNSLLTSSDPASRFSTLDVALKDLIRGQSPLGFSHSLNINGQLKLNDSLVLLPMAQPKSGITGQIYYDNGTNQLAYYNGTQFVSVGGNGNSVQSIGGLTGTIIPVGAGLATSGGQLSNSGVLAVQGQTGNISFVAGQGMAINGTTFSNTGVLSVDTVTGALTLANSTATAGTITINDASTTAKGIAEFNPTNFSATTGTITTIQNINTTATPTFGQLTLTAGPNTSAMLLANNTNASATGNLIDLQSNSVSKFSVSPAGNLTVAGTATITGNLSLGTGSQYQINGVQISSSNLSDSSNIAKLNAAQTFTNTNIFKPSTNSVTAFQVQNASGTTVFDADTTNARVGVGNAAPGFALDVTGDVNTSTVYRIGGTTICTASGCTAAGGSGNFIQNGTTVQANANFAIQSAAAANVGGLIRGAASQTADLFDLQTSTPSTVFSVSSSGAVALKNSVDSTTAFNLRNSVGNNTFTIDSTNGRVGISLGTNTLPGTGLDVNGALRLEGTTTDTFTTPVGSTIQAKINVPVFDPGNFSQFLAAGLPSTSGTSERDVSLFDARTVAHQATLAVFNPQEADYVGFSWEGSNSAATIKTGSSDLALRSGTTNLLYAKSDGSGVGIGNSIPGYKLDVSGDINTSGVYRVGGTSICTSSGCTVASSSGILNGTSIQTNANFAIQSAAAASVGGVIRGAALQTADLLDLQTSTPTTVFSVGSSGSVLSKNSTDSTTAFQVQNAAGNTALVVDSTNLRATIGSSTAPDTTLMVAGDGTGFARIGSGSGCGANYAAISLNGAMSGCNTYNFLSSPTDQVLYINRPLNNSILFRENNVTQFTLFYGGSAQFQNSTNSTSALSVKNAAGSTTVLDADTTNGRVGIGNATPSYPLDVTGDVNTSTVYRIGGTTVCSGTTCTPASGSGSYIQNGTSVQTANFAIQSAAAGSVGGVIRGAVSQTADLLEVQTSTPTTVFKISSSGTFALQNTTNSTTGFNFQNASGFNTFTIDTTNSRVGIALGGSTLPAAALEVAGGLRLSSTAEDTFTTPQNSSVGTKINVPLFDPGNFGQIVAMGVPATASSSARVLSLFDARATAHQGTLAVFNTGESDYVGLSWDGGSAGLLKSSGSDIGIAAGGTSRVYVKQDGSGVGIGNTGPGYKLDVTGDVNTSTVYRIGGTTVCSGTTCTPASGSTNYVQNGTSVQASTNFAIQSAAAASVGGVIRGAASQTADLLDLQNSSGTNLFSISATGHVISGGTAPSITIGAAAGTGAAPTITASSTDHKGTITINVTGGTATGVLATVSFANNYGAAPVVVITPANAAAGSLSTQIPFVSSAVGNFTLNANGVAVPNGTYIYNYIVEQ